MTHMTRTPQRLKKNALVITAQFISLRMVAELSFLILAEKRDGRVVVDLAVRWRYLETRWRRRDLKSTIETGLNSSLSSSSILESWHDPQISSLSCQACSR